MKFLRSSALALAGVLSLGLGLISLVAQPLLHFVAHGCESLSCGLDKLGRDLAQMRSEPPVGSEEIGADLVREGHGYRQASATNAVLLTPAVP